MRRDTQLSDLDERGPPTCGWCNRPAVYVCDRSQCKARMCSHHRKKVGERHVCSGKAGACEVGTIDFCPAHAAVEA